MGGVGAPIVADVANLYHPWPSLLYVMNMG